MIFKRILAFGVICLMTAIMVIPSLKVLNFYKNQSEIIANHCVNKEKPALQCEGHCYLKKQLTEGTDLPQNNSLPEIEIFIPICEQFNSGVLLLIPYYTSTKACYPSVDGNVKSFTNEIFTPPKLITI